MKYRQLNTQTLNSGVAACVQGDSSYSPAHIHLAVLSAQGSRGILLGASVDLVAVIPNISLGVLLGIAGNNIQTRLFLNFTLQML